MNIYFTGGSMFNRLKVLTVLGDVEVRPAAASHNKPDIKLCCEKYYNPI